MFFGTAYDTTMGSVVVVKPIQHALEKALIVSELKSMSLNLDTIGDYKPVFVTGVFQSDSEIPLFTHPITIFNSKGEKYLCTDLRLFLRKGDDAKNIDELVKNRTEFNFVKSRAILNTLWLNGHKDEIRVNLAFAAVVYSAWLTETISKSYALDGGDQLTLKVLCMAYYYSLFFENKELTPTDIDKIAVNITKATKFPAQTVFGIIERVKSFGSVDDLCQSIVDILENVRLQNFNLPALLSIISNTWFGTNSKEIIAVALEHPPTWIAMVYSALTERTYKNSRIAVIAENYGKRGGSGNFEVAYVRTMKENTVDVGPGTPIR